MLKESHITMVNLRFTTKKENNLYAAIAIQIRCHFVFRDCLENLVSF